MTTDHIKAIAKAFHKVERSFDKIQKFQTILEPSEVISKWLSTYKMASKEKVC
jgi:hypothetical protein